MLLTRTIAGGTQFDPTDPTSGLFEFDSVPVGRGEITVKIENAGYNSDGDPHDIEIWLQPAGPIVLFVPDARSDKREEFEVLPYYK